MGSRHWLQIRVAGKKGVNAMGIGSKVRVYQAGMLGKPAGLLGFQEVTTGYGYASGQPALCHFGLGKHAKVDVRVKLPGGKTITRLGVAADRLLVISG